MHRAALVLATLATALWLGGIVFLLVGVQALFTGERAVAARAAPILFGVFQWYGLGVAIVALIATAAALLVGKRAKRLWIAAGLLLLGTVVAALLPAWIMPAMANLQAAGETAGDTFKRLHGASMAVYLLCAASSLGALLLLIMLASPTGQSEAATAKSAGRQGS